MKSSSVTRWKWPEWLTWSIAGSIGLIAIILAEVAPSLTWLWYALTFASLPALFWWQRTPWLRGDLPPDADLGIPSKAAHRTVLFVLGLSLTFQLGRWLADGGAIRAKTGDDDEGYIFLAYQTLGYFNAPPVFALRAPGWPLIMAGWLKLFGEQAIWSIGLYHRLLLATFPPVLYLILTRFLREPVALVAALLSLCMEYNEVIAATALSDLSYVGTGLVSLYALLMALTSNRPNRWLIMAGCLAAIRTAIRVTGAPVALVGALTFILNFARGTSWPQRLKQAALLIAPVLTIIVSISSYNWLTSGHFTPSSGPGITFLTQYVPFMSRTPQTPAISEAAQLLPEIPSERLFASSGDPWIAQYRFTATGRGDPFDYGRLTSRIAREIVLAAPGEYLIRVGQGMIIMLLDPHRHLLPQDWLYWPGQIPGAAPLPEKSTSQKSNLPLPLCNIQYGFGAVVPDEWCQRYEALWASLDFRFTWLEWVPTPLRIIIHLLTISLPYRVRHLLWPLYNGLIAFASLAYLYTRVTRRRLAALLALPLLAEYGLVILVTNGIETRYLFYFYPTYLIAIWISLAHLMHDLQRFQFEGRIRR